MLAVPLQRLHRDRLLGVLTWNHEVGSEIEQQAGSTCEGECRERDPVHQRVDVEVAAEPGADAAEPAPLVGADEAPRGRLVESGGVSDRVGHRVSPLDDAHSIDTAGPRRYRASP